MRYLRALDLSPAVAHLTWNGSWLPSQAAQLVVDEYRPAAAAALNDLLSAYPSAASGKLRELQAVDVSEYLPNDILPKSDRMSMAHGLEVRSPLLCVSVAEFGLALPDRFKCGLRGRGKRLLRELARRRYGIAVAGAPKQGFSIPIHQWIREPGRDLVQDLLAPVSLGTLEFLDGPAVLRVVRDHLAGRRSYGWEIWGLLVLVAWHRARIARVPALPDRPVVSRTIPLAGELQPTVAHRR
jgi:asparagine synthase (glutamine-hydrolysing)